MAEYIEREALLKNIEDFHHTSHIQSITRKTKEEKTLWWGIHSGVNYCRNTVIDAPTADVVEVKHGTWKLHKDGSGTCNQCRFTQKGVWDDDSWQRYCGCCGARMDDIKCED